VELKKPRQKITLVRDMKFKDHKGYTKTFLFFVLTLAFANHSLAQTRTFHTDGIYNATAVDFGSSRIPLSGHWDFYPSKLLSPREVNAEKPSSLMVPSLWSEQPELLNVHYGTYVLKLVLPPGSQMWALELPQLYNSYALFVNDTLRGSNGKPAPAKEQTSLQWKPQYITFHATTDTTNIVLQVSNFHHFKSGIREPIYLGIAPVIRSHFNKAMFSVISEVVVLLLLACFFLFLYFNGRKERVIIYFSSICIAWATRELFSDIYPISFLFPDINWFVVVRTEYLTLFLITIFGTLFINRLFRDLGSDIFKYLVVVMNCIYLAFTLFAPPILFTRWLPLYLITAVVALVYAAFNIIRAMMSERTGAWFLVVGLILSVVTMSYDLIAYKGILANQIMISSTCYILIYLSCAIGLLQHLKIVRSPNSGTNTLRYQDLYK
jgi:hypothetical protein